MIAFLLTQLLVALFGLPVVLHPALRRESMAMRVVAMFVAGSVILTLEALLLSYAGMSWGERTLPLPIVIAAAFAAWKWRADKQPARAETSSRAIPLVAVVVIIIAAGWLIHATHVTRAAVSYENVGVVGAKASRMAEGRGVMLDWRALDTTAALRPADPPLPEIVRAWSEIVLGREAWQEAPAVSTLWFLLTIVAVVTLLAPRAYASDAVRLAPRASEASSDREAWILAAYWAIACSLALVDSQAMGGGEPLFLCFITIAAVAIQRCREQAPRAIAFWALAAMALTRPEGVVFAVAIAATSRVAPIRFMAASLGAAALWFLPAARAGVWLPFRPEFRFDSPEVFFAGSYGLALALPIVMIVVRRRVPALALVALLIALTLPAVAAQLALPPHAIAQPYAERALLALLAVVIVAGAVASFRGVERKRVMPQ